VIKYYKSGEKCILILVTVAAHSRRCDLFLIYVYLPVLMLKTTEPRVATEGNTSRQVNRTGVKKSVRKVLKTVAEVINGGATPTLVSICDHVHKQCTVRGAEATVLVQHVRSACQSAVKKGFLKVDDKVFSLTDTGLELLNSCHNRTSSSINLLLDKLLAEKVNAVAVLHILVSDLVVSIV